jgi:hypothetical protein
MLGTEKVLTVVARAFGKVLAPNFSLFRLQIHIDKAKYRDLKIALGPIVSELFTLEPQNTRFHCVKSQSFTSRLKDMPSNVVQSIQVQRAITLGSILELR